jgi:hypothetical protein
MKKLVYNGWGFVKCGYRKCLINEQNFISHILQIPCYKQLIFMEIENIPLKEMIEKIQKPRNDYNEYIKNCYTFIPKSWTRFFNRLFKN